MITFGWMVLSFERIIILIHPDLSRCGIIIKLVRIISWKLGIFKFLQWFVVMSSICPHCASFKVPAKMSVHVIRCRPGTTSKFHDFHESRLPLRCEFGKISPTKMTNQFRWVKYSNWQFTLMSSYFHSGRVYVVSLYLIFLELTKQEQFFWASVSLGARTLSLDHRNVLCHLGDGTVKLWIFWVCDSDPASLKILWLR